MYIPSQIKRKVLSSYTLQLLFCLLSQLTGGRVPPKAELSYILPTFISKLIKETIDVGSLRPFRRVVQSTSFYT